MAFFSGKQKQHSVIRNIYQLLFLFVLTITVILSLDFLFYITYFRSIEKKLTNQNAKSQLASEFQQEIQSLNTEVNRFQFIGNTEDLNISKVLALDFLSHTVKLLDIIQNGGSYSISIKSSDTEQILTRNIVFEKDQEFSAHREVLLIAPELAKVSRTISRLSELIQMKVNKQLNESEIESRIKNEMYATEILFGKIRYSSEQIVNDISSATESLKKDIDKKEKQLSWVKNIAVLLVFSAVFYLVFLIINSVKSTIYAQRTGEEQLRKLSLAVEQSPVSIVITDKNGTIQYVNHHFTELTGYTSEEAEGKSPSVLKSGKQPPEYYSELWKTISSGNTWKGEFCNLRKDGTVFWESATISPVINTKGDITHYIAVKEDITEKRKLEQSLKESSKTMKTILDNLPVGFVIVGRNKKIRVINETAVKIMRYPSWETAKDALLNKSCHDRYCPIHKQHCPIIDEGKKEIKRQERILIGHDGVEIPIIKSVTPVILNNEEVLLEAFMDVSDLMHAREEAKRAWMHAEKANKAKSMFLANMSHEIRTPMNGVLGMIELALMEDLTEQQRRYLETAMMSAESQLEVINDILDFSKIEAGKIDIESVEFNLRELVEKTVEISSIKALQKGLEVISHIHDDVPDYVVGDPTRIKQVLSNLISNASKFTEYGEIEIQVKTLIEKNEFATIRFVVRDTGIGIPDDKSERLFKEFSQMDSSTSRKFGGTGLGLAICKQLVTLMGGDIVVNSEEGKGSTFTFHLPLKISRTTIPSFRPSEHLKGINILIADDNDTNREVISSYFKNAGSIVDAVSNGVDTLIKIEKKLSLGEQYDVILLDYELGDMDGTTVSKCIRDDLMDKSVIIVMLATINLLSSQNDKQNNTINHCLTKPVKRDELFKTVCRIIQKGPESIESDRETEELISADITDSASKLNVLLVEDNQVNRIIAVRFMELAGCLVDIAENGKIACNKYLENHYDAVFMDIQMPEMDGFEATHHIRVIEKQSDRRTWIIAMTAHAMKEDRDQCLAQGMDDYISKPVSREILSRKIDNLRAKLGKQRIMLTENEKASVYPGSDSILDLEDFIDRTGLDDREIISELLRTFKYEAESIMKNIEIEMILSEKDELRTLLHTLKGMASSSSAHLLHETSRDFETDVKNNVTKHYDAWFEKLKTDYSKTIDRIDLLLS